MKKACSIAGCVRTYKAKGFCNKHYREQPAQINNRKRSQHAYYELHKQKTLLRNKLWAKANRSRMNSLISDWKIKNPDKVKQIELNYRRRNPHVYTEKSAFRRKAVRQATPNWVNRKDIQSVYKSRPSGFHVDHIVPILGKNVCGLNVPWNLQCIPAKENLKKWCKF